MTYLGTLSLLLSCPEVLLIVIQAIVDGFSQVGGDLGAGLVVACPVATRVLAEVRRGLSDDEDLVNVMVIQFIVRIIVIGPVCEFVLLGRHLLHLLVEHEVQLLLVRLDLGLGAGLRSLAALLDNRGEYTANKIPTSKEIITV